MTRLVLFISLLSQSAFATKELSLEDYMHQVFGKNKTVMSEIQNMEGILERKEEASLGNSVFFTTGASISEDRTPIFAVFLPTVYTGVAVYRQTYSLGFNQQLRFGVNWGLNYNLIRTAASGLAAPVDVWQLQPKLDLKIPLWKNLFGRDTRQQLQIAESSAMISHYSEKLKLKMTLTDAENVYWRVVLAQKVLELRKELLGRAQALQAWAKKRTDSHLGDKADLLQANAIAELRQLELDSAQYELRSASLAFNASRGRDSITVNESLDELPVDADSDLKAPLRVGERDDLLIALENEKISRASSISSIERSKPSIDLVGSVALNGANSSIDTSFSQASGLNNTLTSVGVQVSAPLDFGLVGKIHSGRDTEKQAAEWLIEAKRFEQDQEWKEMNFKFNESKKKVKLALSIEKLQREKLMHERDRLTRGRTTTSLVIQFEQDYSQSLLSRILAQAEVTQIYSKLKLLSGVNFTKEIL
ncbi:MAG: TolC family protein [Xanthomonadaceae bacterium]|nr:TolC family protein [Xanthomonadaceae bacterium]